MPATWPGKGPNQNERRIPKVTGRPLTKLGDTRATSQNWIDYRIGIDNLKVNLARAILPTYDGYNQAGSYYGDPYFAGNKPQTGWIEGYVQKNGVNCAGAWVHLYHREDGKLIASLRSNAQGYFKFDHLDPNKDNYFVLAVDPDNVYNVIVYDRIEP